MSLHQTSDGPLRLRSAGPETLIGKICRDAESDPANPQWHGNALYRHMPAEEETKGMPYSYQQKHRGGDKAKDSWCHSPPLCHRIAYAEAVTSCPALASSDRLDLGHNLCFIYRARHSTLDRMRDYLENGFRHCQTDRHVRDAEVPVEASNDRRWLHSR